MHQEVESKVIVGAKQTLRLLEDGSIQEVLIARDADSYVTRQILEVARNQSVPIQYVDSMKRLGKEYGVSIGAATVGILKPGKVARKQRPEK